MKDRLAGFKVGIVEMCKGAKEELSDGASLIACILILMIIFAMIAGQIWGPR